MNFMILFLCLNTLFGAEKMIATGEVFDKEGKEKKFDYERYQNIAGDKIFDRTIYKDLSGEILVEEKLETKNNELVRYDIEQKQLSQTAWIEVTDKDVVFNLKKFRKNNYPQTVKKPDNFIVGLQIVPFIKTNWDSLSNDVEKEIKLGVWNRQEAITFKLTKEKSAKEKLVIKMNPSSFLIRAVVDPIYFTFDIKSKALTEYKGRTTPKEKRGSDFYDYDGLTRYKTL